MKTKIISSFIIAVLIAISFLSCEKNHQTIHTNIVPSVTRLTTQNVIIVVIDGARYSETWGDSLHQYIPRMHNYLAPQGVVYNAFYNNGGTVTSSGHTAITTGYYENVENTGQELPSKPSIFQYWLKQKNNDTTLAWVIASKDKLEILADCNDPNFAGQYNPSTNCGVAGLGVGSGYRDDSTTLSVVMNTLNEYHPNLMLVNFREPDFSAHSSGWGSYVEGLRKSDEYAYQIWDYINSDCYYKGKTTLFITNDHGRHLDSVASGFASHGDDCEGCKHIFLYAYGPDFKKGLVTNIPREQIDISATIAKLLNFNMPTSDGKVMKELFKD